MSTRTSHNKMILDFLKGGRVITTWDAIKLFRCTRLSGRIYDLRVAGHTISTEMKKEDGKQWAEYTLIKEAA